MGFNFHTPTTSMDLNWPLQIIELKKIHQKTKHDEAFMLWPKMAATSDSSIWRPFPTTPTSSVTRTDDPKYLEAGSEKHTRARPHLDPGGHRRRSARHERETSRRTKEKWASVNSRGEMKRSFVSHGTNEPPRMRMRARPSGELPSVASGKVRAAAVFGSGRLKICP